MTSVDETGFDPIDSASGKGKRAAYQVEYSALSKHELAKEMKKEIDHVAGALSVNVCAISGVSNDLNWESR